MLTGGGGATLLADPITLSVRPEALSRQDPSRMTVQQTLGGAWADSFGAGVASINISGHTGWRRNVGSSRQSNGEDGVERFLRLRDTIFTQWHDERALAVKAGTDPSRIQLIFADGLDNFTSVVAPMSFVLQRSRSRPLLMQYQISMAVLNDTIGSPGVVDTLLPASGDILRTLGLTSLADSIDRIETLSKSVSSVIETTIAAPVKQFMATSILIYKRVDAAVRSVDGVASSLIGVAQSASRAGMNVFRTIGLIAGLPQRAVALMSQVAAAYSNVFCLLRNAIKRLPQYDDYDSLYGASNCSSTGGGRPLSTFSGGANTFAAIAPADSGSDINITTSGQAGLQALVRSDVVLSPMSKETLAASLSAVNLGLSLA